MNKQIISRTNPKILNTTKVEFEDDILGKNSEAYDWVSLIKYLRHALNKPICHGTTPHVVLSNHFVRYAVVPWKNEISKADERIAYAKHCFVETFGERIKNWNFCLSQPAYGQSTIASAIEPNLITQIHQIFDEVSMPLNSITPELMLTFNYIINQATINNLIQPNEGSDLFWIASVQNQQLCLALLDQSGWRLLRQMMIEIDVIEQIKTIIHREIIRNNLQKDIPVLLYWPELDKSNHILNKLFSYIPPFYLDEQKNLTSELKSDWVIA